MAEQLTVLLIEDSDTDARLIEERFAEVIELRRVTRIADAHAAGECDLILLDLLLGDTNGVETVRACRAAFPYMPIVVLTAIKAPKMQAECMAAGADWFLTKNIDTPETILRAMEAAVYAHAARTGLVGEVEATRRYVKRARELIDEIERRIAELAR